VTVPIVTRRQVILWEVVCVSAELAGVGLGLGCTLGLNNWEGGAFILIGVFAASVIARFWHYGSLSAENP
jgi:hypothetical protein